MRSRLPVAASLLLAASFAWILGWSGWIAPDDEAIYMLMARWMTEGVVPYRDFFFGHPPGRLLLALPVAATGAHPAWAHIVPGGFFLLAAVGVHVATARHVGRGWAPVAVLALLLTGPILQDGALLRGMAPVTAAAAWALVLVGRDRWFAAGVVMSLAGLVAFHVAPILAGLGLIAIRGRGHGALVGYLRGLALLVAALLLLSAAFGSSFLDPVFGYHVRKSVALPYSPQGQLSFLLGFFEIAGPVVVLGALGGLFVALGPRLPFRVDPDSRTVQLAAAACVALYLVAVLGFTSVHRYFLCPMMAPLALLAAHGARGIVALIRHAADEDSEGGRAPAWAPAVATVVLVLGFLGASREGLGNQYNRTRQLPDTEAGVRRVAADIDERLPAGTTLLGDSTLTPWLSWISGRRIAAREVDINHKRFLVGLATPADVVQRARADNLGGVVTVDQSGIQLVPDFVALLEAEFVEAATWEDVVGVRTIRLWVPARRSDARRSGM